MSGSQDRAESLTGELREKLSALANRLRLIQIELSDESVETRRDYISEQVQQALTGVPRQQQQVFLSSLEELFPTWDPNVAVGDRSGQQARETATDARELEDPSFLVARLIELAPSLSADQKAAVRTRLQEAGLSGGGGGLPPEMIEALRKRLNVPDDLGVDVERTLELTMLLGELAGSLDQVAWPTWRQMSKRSAGGRRGGELRGVLGQYVGGDPEVPTGQMTEEFERLRKLVVAMISAVSRVGHQFAEQHLVRFNPEEISSLVKLEGGGFFVSQEVKCWRRYEELAKSLHPDSIQDEILKIMVELVIRLSQGIAT